MTDDEVIRIPLRARDGSVRAWAIVDREDADLAELRWSYLSQFGYAVRTSGVVSVYLHRVILGRAIGHNPLSGERCDHVNGDGLDNRRDNLRVASHAQNMRNRRASGRSKYLGVCWHAASSKWQAEIRSNGQRSYLGVFVDESDAARAYDRAAIESHGEFARLNFPDGGDA